MLQGEGAAIKDVVEAGILDLYVTKFWGMKYAINAASTILKVDQIIMAKRAGGPKAPSAGGGGAGDDDE
jgi:T-complex protein 1 subunit theta